MNPVSDLIRDFRYALRVLLKSRLATSVAVVALALGIAVNASTFVSVNAMLLHPFPYPHLDRIVTVWETMPRVHSQNTALAPADYADVAAASRSFEKLAAYRTWDVSLTGIGNPQRVEGYRVSTQFFGVLGMQPLLGRTFADGEDRESRTKIAVVSEAFWKSHLAGSKAAIGATITLNGEGHTVVGVMPDTFDFPLAAEVWAPLTLEPVDRQDRKTRNLPAIGLLKAGVPVTQARAELKAIASQLEKQYPDTNEGRGLSIIRLRDMAEQTTNHFLITLLGASLFVLLLACANIGNLQLARAAGRDKEIAVRTALGASRFQIARQLIAECLLLSIAAGAVGLFLASWNTDYMKTNIPAIALKFVPGLHRLQLDWNVALYALLLSIAAGLLCSAPAISQALRERMSTGLNDALRGRSGSASRARERMRATLIVSELALALVLLVGSGLMVKTFERLLYVYQGFDPKNLLTMQVALPATEYRDNKQVLAFYDRAVDGLGAVREVESAALSSRLAPPRRFSIEGLPEPRAGEPRPAIFGVSGLYFQTMRIPMLRGRAITERDRASAPRVVVISENVARHYWPQSDPIGHRIRLDGDSGWLTIVGVAGDIVEDWFNGRPTPAAYVSYAQFPDAHAMFALRTSRDPILAAKAARRTIAAIDKNLPVYEVKTMEQAQYEQRGGVRSAAISMAEYASIALLLAITGIYAVISYFVAARTHDIGVHMALGASRGEVLRMTLGQSVRLIATGLAIGIPLAFALARLMSAALYGAVNLDATVFVFFGVVLAGSGLLASYVPAYRATRIDPMVALRNE